MDDDKKSTEGISPSGEPPYPTKPEHTPVSEAKSPEGAGSSAIPPKPEDKPDSWTGTRAASSPSDGGWTTDYAPVSGAKLPIKFTPIIISTILAGTFLMSLSILIPVINGGESAAKEVLPFATGLLGFLGGLVTGVFTPGTTRQLSMTK